MKSLVIKRDLRVFFDAYFIDIGVPEDMKNPRLIFDEKNT